MPPILKDWEALKDGVQVVVIKGEGGKAFCAGGDMQKHFFVEEY